MPFPGTIFYKLSYGATVYRRVRKIAKHAHYLCHACLSVCLTEWKTSPPTKGILVKFDI